MDLAELGWDAAWQDVFEAYRAPGVEPGRVVGEEKHQFRVVTATGETAAGISGKFLRDSPSHAALPKVGDWVALTRVRGEDKAMICRVCPRRTLLARKVPGRETEEQVLVANVDVALAVHAADASWNPRRLERHLVMILQGGPKAVVVLNKMDCAEDPAAAMAAAKLVAGDIPVLGVSAHRGAGLKAIAERLVPGRTAVLIGASGVGKSTLINRLFGEEILETTEVRENDLRGRHTTTRREFIRLPNGALIIDTPGLREVQLWSGDIALQAAFADVEALALRCHFRDCRHVGEARCAVRAAVEAGTISTERYEGFLKLRAEQVALQLAQRERRYVDRRRQSQAAHRSAVRSQRNRD
jgi:ribosome biogenesis GTPase / thiamine phosphate phosphatase